MNKIVTIYCEGKAGSHDYDIISKVIDKLPNSPQIEPIGGVRGAGSIIQYRESGGLVTKSDSYFFFRDRDFDRAIPEQPCLEHDERRTWLYYSYRNTIENYLFSPTHLFSFANEKNIAKKYAIIDEDAARGKLIEATERIRIYQAVRHTMGKMRTGETNFGTKWTEKSGILPENLEKDYCTQKALEKIATAKNIATGWDENTFIEILDSFLSKFDTKFMEDLQSLCYFHGKDIAKSITDICPSFPMTDYFAYAKKHFDYRQFPDLVTLRNKIENAIIS